MNKYFAFLLAILCAPLSAEHHRNTYSRSFMFTKPAYYNIVAEQALWHDIAYNKRGTLHGGIQVMPFFQRSIDLNRSARYFLIGGKTELLVSGDAVLQNIPIRDVRAEWLNLPANFQGTLSINPRQQQFGFTIEYNQDLKKWFDVQFARDMYISIIAPVVCTQNNINLTQTNIANPGTTIPQDIIQAFDQPTWFYGKMTGKKHTTNLAELKILLGTTYESKNYLQVNYNSVLVIPVAKKQNAEFLFDPVVGNNHHMGVGAALNIQALLNRNPERVAFCWFLDLESVILIRNKQYRTFDLRGKPWSRFLQMNKIGAEPTTNVPGVNLLTRRATIKPFNVVDFAMGWRTKTKRAEFEAGWGIWGHGYERIDHLEPFNEIFGIAGNQPGKTASRSTIAQQAPNDPNDTFVPITLFDVDAQSAANAGALNFRVFMSAGIISLGKKDDGILGLGWSIDLPYKNAMLQVWNVWIKLGATF
jgi:hypothetical protein